MRILRRALEQASRGVVLQRRLPGRLGGSVAFVSSDAALRYWRPSLERAAPEVFSWAEELVQPGNVVWDLGANLGLFSLAAAVRAGAEGEVLAVEPDPWLCGLIDRSRARLARGAASIEVLQSAVGERDGEASFLLSGRGRAASHLQSVPGTSQAGRSRGSIDVRVRALDSLAAGRRAPSLIKIDVEGAEALALRGALRLLEAARPVLLVEVGGDTAAEIGETLRGFGYRMFDAERPPGQRSESQRPFWNTLALPAEGERTRE